MKEILIDYKPLVHISHTVDKDSFKEVLEKIYDSQPADYEIWFWWENEYISFIFEDCDEWKASTYIVSDRFTYLRRERTLEEVYEIILKDYFNNNK